MALGRQGPALGPGPRRNAARYARASVRRAAFAALAATVFSSACTSTVDAGPPPPPVGDAIIDWTVEGTTDSTACVRSGAATLHLVLYDSRGAFAGEYLQDCTVFATTISGLYADEYTGRADLRDADGRVRTTTIALEPFDVLAGEATEVALDFPSDSFY